MTGTCFGSDFTSELKKKSLIKIPLDECKEMESKIGQLLYASITLKVGASAKNDNDYYLEAVKDLNLGGVLPHYSERDPQRIYEAGGEWSFE